MGFYAHCIDRAFFSPCRSNASRDLRTAGARRRADGAGADRSGRRFAACGVQTSGGFETGRPRARPPRRTSDSLQRPTARSDAAARLDQSLRSVLARPVRSPRNLVEQDGPMTDAGTATHSIVIERVMPHPPERIWRALTQGPLIEEWLMKNDFQPVVGHRFNLRTTPMPGRLPVSENSEHLKQTAGAKEYNQAAVMDKLVTGLPEVVKALASPLAKVDHITVVSTGNGDSAGLHKITGDLTQIAAQVPELFEALSGMKMSDLLGKITTIGEKSKRP